MKKLAEILETVWYRIMNATEILFPIMVVLVIIVCVKYLLKG
jgi:hypothetical protein